MTPPKKKLLYLESLRGLAAMTVVLFHLMLAFYPSLDPKTCPYFQLFPHPMGALNFLSIFIPGRYAVRLFFLLSGFVLAISYFRKQQIAVLSSAALRRYPRLMIPVFASVLFAWIIQAFHGYRNIEAAGLMHQSSTALLPGLYTQNISAIQALKQGLLGTFFYFDYVRTLNEVLWSMPIELKGSFFVFSFTALLGQLHRRFLIYVMMAFLTCYLDPYLLDFLCGVALSDLFVSFEKSKDKIEIPLWASLLMVVAGFVTGSLSTSFSVENPPFYIHGLLSSLPTLASLLIVGAAVFSSPIQTALEHATISFLGKLSFPLYLFHLPILCSLGCGCYLDLRDAAFSHMMAALLSSALVVTCTVVVAWIAYYTVELPSIIAGGKFAGFFHLPRLGGLAAE